MRGTPTPRQFQPWLDNEHCTGSFQGTRARTRSTKNYWIRKDGASRWNKVQSAALDRSLFLLGHKWGTITSKGARWSGSHSGVLIPRKGWVWDGVVPSRREGLPNCGIISGKYLNICKFAFKIVPSGALNAKTLASVVVQNGTVKWRRLAC